MPSTSTGVDHPAHKLRQELERCLVRKDHSSRAFISKNSIDKCWPGDRSAFESKLGLQSWKKSLLSILNQDCRIITCILSWMRYEPFDQKLEELCTRAQRARQGKDTALLLDSQLVITPEECDNVFGVNLGQYFYQSQFVFTPILISAAAKGVHEVHDERRWPFPLEPEEIGFGAYGTVYKASIVQGQLEESKDSSNDKNKVVAYKSIKKPDDWRKEVKNLDFLKESLSGHKRLILHIAAFIQGPRFYIFLPYTPLGDLETFLQEGSWEDDNSTDHPIYDFAKEFKSFQASDLATEFAAIIDATAYLHDRVSSARGIPVFCAHADLRPKNILIFPGDEEHPAGVWHISDFGISSIQLEGGHRLPEPVRVKYPSMGDILGGRWTPSGSLSASHKLVGPHVAPEMSIHGISKPKESDVWSLGCIFMEVLVFGLGTKQKGNRRGNLDEFRIERRSRRGSTRDDYFFDLDMDAESGSGEFEVMITRRPKVDEWLRYIHDQSSELHHGLAEIINQMLQADPSSRCSAKDAYEFVLKTCNSYLDADPDRPKAKDLHPEKRDLKPLQATPWQFRAVQNIDEKSLGGGLIFSKQIAGYTTDTQHTRKHDPAEDGQFVDETVLERSRTRDTVRSLSGSFQRRQTIEVKTGTSRIWSEDGSSLPETALSVKLSSSHGIAVYLCQKQMARGTAGFWSPKKNAKHKGYELRIRLAGQQTTEFKASPAYQLPSMVDWQDLCVNGDHAAVVGNHLEKKTREVHIFDILDRQTVCAPDDSELRRMRKFVPSAHGAFAAYDTKGFALWQADQPVFKPEVSPPLGASGQIVFGSTGSFLFTWSCKHQTDVIHVWTVEHDTKPQVCATYTVPRPPRRGPYEMILIPCGSLPACILRNAHGRWFTASMGPEADSNGKAIVTEQPKLESQVSEKVVLYAANERHLFFVSANQEIYTCDLVWGNDITLHVQPKSVPLSKVSVNKPRSMVLHDKQNGKYELIICNREGAIESIEVEC